MAQEAATTLYSGVGEANPIPPMSFKHGYSEVGKKIFGIDTTQLKHMRETNLAKQKKEASMKKRP